jgi:hypothetical protein
MTTFLQPDDATNVDSAEFRQKRDKDRVACFLHLRDLVYLHRETASRSAIAFVQSLEAKVIAQKATRQQRLVEVRERVERVKAAAEQAKTALTLHALDPTSGAA